MVTKVGINGFGRIGRIVARACLEDSDLQLSVINDPAVSVEYICYLIKFDSTHGKLKGDISHNSNEVIVNGTHIKVYHDKLPTNVPWEGAGVQYVVESSGMFTNYDKAKGHLDSKSVKRVIVTAPSADVPTVILGVNDKIISEDMKVISCGSSTLYCLAPIVKVLDENFGVEEGFVTSIHAMTPSLKPLDGLCLRGRHWREHRSIHQNIIPAATGACKALGKILPQVRDKLSGLAFRVPIVNVSVLDLTVRLTCATTLHDITKAVQEYSETTLRNIIRVSNEESVSSDFNGDTHSCIFDEDSSLQLKSDFFKIICWYENEYSYACRVIDVIKFCEKPKMATFCVERKGTHFVHRKVMKKPKSLGNDVFVSDGVKMIPTPSGSVSMNITPPESPNTKPTTYQTFPCKETKKNEIFRIWNDTEDGKPKRNRNAFFQSCTVLPPKSFTMFSAQQRLENVKKQFSKMVDITENLLMKSNRARGQTMVIEPEAGDDSKVQLRDATPSQTTNKCDIQTTDEQPDLLVEDNITSEEKPLPSIKVDCKDESISDQINNNTERKQNIEREFKDIIAKLTYNTEQNIDQLSSKTLTFDKLGNTNNNGTQFKKRVSKTINNIIEGLTKNTEKCDDDKVLTAVSTKNSANELDENHCKDVAKSVHCQQNASEYHISLHTDEGTPLKYNSNDDNHLKREKRSLKLVDSEFRKRNIILVGNKLKEDNIYHVKMTGDREEESMDLSKVILKELEQNPKSLMVLSRDNISCSSLGTVPSMKNILTSNKQDIYDKLDSPSGSDSENSFEVTKKKSQVVHITDLTNSIEDLVRLDKICRIIEISDDLSDQLFSSLDRGSHVGTDKWSFKDLCERIKLDEFCNKVFGGTVVERPE